MQMPLTVGEHIAIVQRTQVIATTDYAKLVRVQHELAEARAELKRLRRGLGAACQRSAGEEA